MANATPLHRNPQPANAFIQEKFRIVGTKNTSDCTQQQVTEWLNATARADMEKAGNDEDLTSKRETIGGFV